MFAHLALIVLATAVLAQEQPNLYPSRSSQEVFNARTHDKIVNIEQRLNDNSKQIAAFVAEMTALRSSLDRFTGIGIGIGAALTALQVVQVILMKKKTQ